MHAVLTLASCRAGSVVLFRKLWKKGSLRICLSAASASLLSLPPKAVDHSPASASMYLFPSLSYTYTPSERVMTRGWESVNWGGGGEGKRGCGCLDGGDGTSQMMTLMWRRGR